jgi:predicted transcriptional regulator
MEDILKSIKAQLYERAISPLTGSFIIAWCLWNYKFVLVLFSGLSIPDKFEWIECELFDTWQEVWLLGLLYPLLSTAIYLFIYPFIAKPVFKFVRQKQVDMMNDKKRIDGGTLLTDKQSQVLYSKIDQLEEEQQKIIDRKDREIERRDAQIKQYSADMLEAEEDKKSAVDELTKLKQTALTKKNRDALHALADDNDKGSNLDQERTLSNEEVEILRVVADGESGVRSSYLIDKVNLHRIKFAHFIEVLLDEGYIEVNPFGEEATYYLTSVGSSYLLGNNLI